MKRRRFFTLLAIVLVALSMSSCIELIEEMHINKDKSGTWEVRLEAMGLQTLLGSVGSYLGDEMVGDWKSIPKEGLQKLKKVKGISNIETTKSGEFLIGLKFDFENQRALNKALYALGGIDKKFFYPKLYKVKKHKFKKVDIGKLVYKQLSEQVDKLENKSWLEYVSYKSIYHLPYDEVKVKSKKDASYKLKKNVYTQTHNLLQLSSQDNELGIKVRY